MKLKTVLPLMFFGLPLGASVVSGILRIFGVTALAITIPYLPPAVAGANYTVGMSASGGKPPYRWFVSKNLPTGLAVSGTTILGIPAHPSAEIPVQFTVIDKNNRSIAVTLPLLVCNAMVIRPQTFAPQTVGVSMSRVQIVATGGASSVNPAACNP